MFIKKKSDSDDKERSKVTKVKLRRLMKLAGTEKLKLILATMALLISSFANLIIPKLMGGIVDSVLVGGMPKLIETTIFLAIFFFVENIFGFIRMTLFTIAGEKIVVRLRRELFQKLTTQEIGFFDVTRTGEMVNRLASDCSLIQNTVSVNISQGLRNALHAIGGFVILFLISWKLTLVMFSIIPLIGVATFIYGKYIKKYTKQVQDSLAKATNVADESLGNMRTVRSFVAENKENKRYTERVFESYKFAKKRAIVEGLFANVSILLANFSITGVLFYGGTLVLKKEMTAGLLTTFVIYTLTVGFSFGSLSSLYADFMRAMGATERVFELIDRVPEVRYEGGLTKPNPKGEILFKNVSFAYPSRKDVKVLKDLNFEISPGKVIALVGPSGGGKSTIAQLIAGLYYPTEGEITFDGINLIDIDPQFLRSQVSSVSQEPTLFACSIIDNICYGVPDDYFISEEVKMERVIEVAKMANAYDFINEFPDKFNTLVGENGVRLSGGQKQRIAIARALLTNPKVLILDEATSALDSESEYLVKKALDSLLINNKSDRSCLVIAHRLSTVKNADLVMVIYKGSIVESGTHEELLQKKGVYSKLVSRQLTEEISSSKEDI